MENVIEKIIVLLEKTAEELFLASDSIFFHRENTPKKHLYPRRYTAPRPILLAA